MANLKFSDLYPLGQIGGASSSIAGLTSQGVKSTDFTSTPNSLYEITSSCLMTLHSSPTIGDKIGFVLTSTANFDITSTEKFNGSFLAIDYVKRVTQLYAIIVLTYSGSTNGWVWENRDNGYISDAYGGTGVLLTWTNNSTLNGVFDYVGKNNNTTSWSNPYSSKVTTSVNTSWSTSGSAAQWQNLFDKSTTANSGDAVRAFVYDNHYLQVNFSTCTISPNRFLLYNGDLQGQTINVTVQVLSNGTYQNIANIPMTNTVTSAAISTSIDTTSIRFVFFPDAEYIYLFLYEVEIWGLVKLL